MVHMKETAESSEGPASRCAGKYLTFRLHRESFGIAVLQVREIMRLPAITHVPRLPEHIRGVINLRGKIIPVIDLRLRFAMPGEPDAGQACVIVVQVGEAPQRHQQIGLVVDAVEEVASIGAQDIEQTPDFGSSLETAYILGMAKVKGAVKTLLNIDRVLVAENADSVMPALKS
jgi:purine-binding chemotaxis protein CheW